MEKECILQIKTQEVSAAEDYKSIKEEPVTLEETL